MSLDVDTVILNMDTVNFLGISIVGQSSARGDNGIYVANIMKGNWLRFFCSYMPFVASSCTGLCEKG